MIKSVESESESEFVVGLDVGSSVVRAVVGEKLSDGQFNILAIGTQQSKGLEKGCVTDVDAVVNAIRLAIGKAQNAAKMQINEVYCSISGEHIKCFNEHGMVPIVDDVKEDDIVSSIETAKSIKLPADCNRLLHAIEQSYTIDNQVGIRNPIGISGCRMEAFVHLIAANSGTTKNLEKCVERVEGLKIKSLVFGGLASAKAVLSPDEMEIGVCLVDIGGGTMDICIYTEGALRYSGSIKYSGGNATKDLAYSFSTQPSVAEKIKLDHGTVDLNQYKETKSKIMIKSVSGTEDRELDLAMIAEVLNPRYTELMELIQKRIKLVQKELEKNNKSFQLGAGVVLTGGGSKIPGLLNLSKSVFSCPVRLGCPSMEKGVTDVVNTPEFSTVVGLLLHGGERTQEFNEEFDGSVWNKIKSTYKKFIQKIREMY